MCSSDLVSTPADLSRAVEAALANPARLSDARHAAERLFAYPGRATARALGVVYDLLELMPPPSVERQIVSGAGATARTTASTATHAGADARVSGTHRSVSPRRHEAA